jgi:putative polyketide hydroxylase
VTFAQDGDGVTATLAGPGGLEEVRTPYLVAADGTSSPARAALGIGASRPGDPGAPPALLADRFAAGRVFLAGDAAHTVPPAALGLDAGIADAHNLAWKLAAVITGQAGPALLGTYEAERRPVAEMTVAQALLRLDQPGPGETQGSGAAGDVLSAPVVHLGYRYDSAAVIDPQPALPSATDITLDLDGSPGTRVPHAWLVSDGQRRSTLDLVQSRFTVLAGPEGELWAEAAREAAARLGLPVGAYRIAAGAAGASGETVSDTSGRWAERAGLAGGGALLVRPDQFVAWRSPTLPADPAAALTAALAGVLSR